MAGHAEGPCPRHPSRRWYDCPTCEARAERLAEVGREPRHEPREVTVTTEKGARVHMYDGEWNVPYGGMS